MVRLNGETIYKKIDQVDLVEWSARGESRIIITEWEQRIISCSVACS